MIHSKTIRRISSVAAVLVSLLVLTALCTRASASRRELGIVHAVEPRAQSATGTQAHESSSLAAASGVVHAGSSLLEAQRRHAKALHQAQLQLFATTFEKERVDSLWAPGAETAIRAVVSGAQRTVLDTQVKCKTTLCLVSFKYDDPSAGQAVIQQMLLHHPWAGGVFTRNDVKARAGTSYFSRQGRAAPRVAPDSVAL